MKTYLGCVLLLIVAIGCSDRKGTNDSAEDVDVGYGRVGGGSEVGGGETRSLTDARKGFQTTIVKRGSQEQEPPEPPDDVFRRVKYPSPAGSLWAYVTPDPNDGRKHPAMLWITGGDCNSIDAVWEDAPRENDQTAAAYRRAGIVMMFPSLRGGNDNPGTREGFFGEVDDVRAARDFLATQSYVDPQRIYLGGHSTGGTLAILVAETDDRYRAAFAFGPVAEALDYGGRFVYHDTTLGMENKLRSPILWLHSVRSPLFVIEGVGGNITSLHELQTRTRNDRIRYVEVPGVDHFEVLAPTNEVIAKKILADQADAPGISLVADEIVRHGL